MKIILDFWEPSWDSSCFLKKIKKVVPTFIGYPINLMCISENALIKFIVGYLRNGFFLIPTTQLKISLLTIVLILP